MEFIITKTSTAYKNSKPCPCAIKKGNSWVTEINTIKGLMAFAHNHGKLIISNYADKNFLEIYDDYRE